MSELFSKRPQSVIQSDEGQLDPRDLIRYAEELGLDVKSFTEDLRGHRWSERVAADIESADVSGVAGTPSFFVNGQRQMGAYDLATLSRQQERLGHRRTSAITGRPNCVVSAKGPTHH